MNNLKYILGFLAFLVASFFIYDVVSNKENPCGQLFETTSASLTTKINLLKKDSSLIIGRNRIQELSSSAQQTALSLQSCCIAAHTSVITGEQFLQCQTGANTYASRLDAITTRLAELEKQNAPIVIASNKKTNDALVSADESEAMLKPSAPQPRMMPSAKVAESAKMNKKYEIDQLINKALSASINFKKNVAKVVK